MHLPPSIIATLAAASAAFRVLECATDGVYAAYYDELGNEVHVKEPKLPKPTTLAGIVSATPEKRAVTKPGISRARCSSSPSELIQLDCDGAVQQIKDGIQGSGGQAARYALRGNVVVFPCNRFGSGSSRFNVSNFTSSLAVITRVLDVGYMNNDPMCSSVVYPASIAKELFQSLNTRVRVNFKFEAGG